MDIQEEKYKKMSEEMLTSVRIPTFDGEEEKFQVGWTRVQAFVRVKRFEKGAES